MEIWLDALAFFGGAFVGTLMFWLVFPPQVKVIYRETAREHDKPPIGEYQRQLEMTHRFFLEDQSRRQIETEHENDQGSIRPPARR